MAKPKASKTMLMLDLTDYKSRTSAKVDPGEYTVRVVDVEKSRTNNGNDMVTTWLQIKGGEFDGDILVDRMTVTEKSVFRLVNFMQAIGMKVKMTRFRLDVAKFKGQTLRVLVADGEEYRGRIPSDVVDYMRAKKVTAKGGSDEDPWATDEDEDDETEEFETEEVEDEDEAVEEAVEDKPKKKAKKSKKPEPEPEEDEDEDEDEDDEPEPAPKKAKKAPAKKAPAKKKAKPVDDDDDDDDEDDDDDDVDLDKVDIG